MSICHTHGSTHMIMDKYGGTKALVALQMNLTFPYGLAYLFIFGLSDPNEHVVSLHKCEHLKFSHHLQNIFARGNISSTYTLLKHKSIMPSTYVCFKT